MKNNKLNIEVTRPDQVVIVMRGIPGSFKSTTAKTLVGDGAIHSTDDVIEAKGDYREFFKKMIESKDFVELSRAHSLNLKNALESVKSGISPVILDNTNIKMNEPKAFVVGALKLGISDENIKFVDLGTNGASAEELAERNSHGVPLDKIEQMIASHKGQGEITLDKVLAAKDMYKTSDVLYSCVLLDIASKNAIMYKFGIWIPKDWHVFNHHMTITLGEMKDKSQLGEEVTLTVTKIGLSEMALALQVEGFRSTNKIPHITLAINPEGGKPVMSNEITKWQDVKHLNVLGIVTEIKRKNE